jgi:hypothetical protein
MHSLRFTAETSSNGVVERDFMVGDVPGVLWSPVSGCDHAPLVLMGHGGGLHKKTPALVARAHVDRQSALALFDAFASKEKTLHANPGDHRTIRWVGVDKEFLARHLGGVRTSRA